MAEVYDKKQDTRRPDDTTPHNEYPHNQVWQFAGGLKVMVGNKNGEEHLKIHHPSGSYTEIFPNGSKNEVNQGEVKHYGKSGFTTTIDHNGDMHVHGHKKVTMGGGAHFEIQGDAGMIIGGKTAMVALGDLGLSINGNALITAKGNMNLNAMGKMDIQAKGTTYVGSGSGMTVQATSISLNPSDGASGYTT